MFGFRGTRCRRSFSTKKTFVDSTMHLDALKSAGYVDAFCFTVLFPSFEGSGARADKYLTYGLIRYKEIITLRNYEKITGNMLYDVGLFAFILLIITMLT